MEIKSIATVYLFLFVCSISAKDYEEDCVTNSECNGTAFITCIKEYDEDTNGTCLCPLYSHWEPLLLKYKGYSECNKNQGAECKIGEGEMKCALNAECVQNTCKCKAGFIPSKDSKYNPFQICVGTYDTPCEGYDGFPASRKRCDSANGLDCDGTSFKCSCGSDKLWSSSRQKCLTKIQNSCSSDDDCVENASCEEESKICTCGKGYSPRKENGACYVSHENTCGEAGKTGCNPDELTVCTINGKCECPDGMQYKDKDDKCRHLVGGNCADDSDCYSEFCHPESKKCLCRSYELELSNNTCIGMNITSGGYCTGDEHCLEKNFMSCNLNATVESNYGLCECNEGMVYEDKECRIQANGDCSENGNCVTNGQCIEKMCQCSEYSTITSDNFCHLNENQPCDNDNNLCSHELGLICELNYCRCPEGQIWEYSETAKLTRCVALVSGNCSDSVSFCTTNATCTMAGICECVDGFTATPIHASRPELNRRCLRAHNQTCDDKHLCNPYDFLTCSENGKCGCKLPLQQTYDSEVGKCLSVSEGFCGKLDENDFNQSCAKHSKCFPDLQGIFRCVCDETGIAVGAPCPAPKVEENKGVRTCGVSVILLLIVSFIYLVVQT